MKGMEMAVNVMVIAVLITVVMAALVWLFINNWMGGTSTLEMQNEKARACSLLVQTGCKSPVDIKVTIKDNPNIQNLLRLCAEMKIIGDCAKSCGC